MAEDRFAVIEKKLDDLAAAVAAGQATTDARLVKVDARLAGLEAGQGKADARFAALEAGQARADTRLAALEAGQKKLENGQQELRGHMHVLHEDLVDKLKALDPAPLMRAMQRELVALIETKHDEVSRRLEPLERAFQERSRRRRPH